MIMNVTRGVYVGVDISIRSLFEALKRHESRICVIAASLTHLPFRDEIFNQIVCSEVLEHIPDWKEALKELHRVLRMYGVLIVSTPNVLSLYFPQKIYLERKSKAKHPYDQWKSYWTLKSELRRLGLKIVDARGACILPGHICYKPLIKRLLKPLLPLLEVLDNALLSRTPLRYFGYICVIKSKKMPPLIKNDPDQLLRSG